MLINYPKTVLIPLWPEDVATVLAEERLRAPDRPYQIARRAKYLGFQVGPDGHATSWDKPLVKYEERLRLWNWSLLGLQFALKVYHTFVLPVLSFVCQLRRSDPRLRLVEAKALRLVLPGPGGWLTLAEAHGWRSWYGCHFGPRDMAAQHLAARLRVAHWEQWRKGGLPIQQRTSDLDARRRRSDFVYRAALWRDWYDSHPYTVLHQATAEAATRGALLLAFRAACPPSRRSHPAAVRQWERTHMQSWFTSTLQVQAAGPALPAIRRRLLRFTNQQCSLQQAHKCHKALTWLARHVPPRVWAAVLSTLHNRWCTSRRFQHRTPAHFCRLGCGLAHGDALEHYAGCKTLRIVFRNHLRDLQPGDTCLPHWLGLRSDSPADWLRHALHCYAAYRTVGSLAPLSAPHNASAPEAARMLKQFWKDGTKGLASALLQPLL
jgi:hypothetical protein